MIFLPKMQHSMGVGRKMAQIATKKGLSKEQIEDCFLLGLLHDIGYEYTEDFSEHEHIGGKVLERNGYRYWREVYYHGHPTDEYQSLYLDILNAADQQVDTHGNDVGYENRLKDIKIRYGETSKAYKDSCVLQERLKSLGL